MTRYVFMFDEHPNPSKEILGGKGYGLAVMSKIGLPVPYGFTITTETCKYGKDLPEDVVKQIDEHLIKLEKSSGKKFGDPENPLLVSVRSGAAVSMPGMMDTVLNLGLNDDTRAGLAKKTNNPRFAADSYRRFMQMFGNVVMEIEHDKFEKELNTIKNKHGKKLDTDLTTEELDEVIVAYRALIQKERGEFPTDPKKQLRMAIDAVFSSWMNPRAIAYRKLNDIRGLIGTAVNVQMMVFGNTGETSGTGVGFTRNPSTGENVAYGEYLLNAQGEDVVAGIRTPHPISVMEKELPDTYKQLMDVFHKLEEHFKDMQDLEFTVEEGKLFMLQCRSGKRTAAAAVRIAVEMVKEGLITKEDAIMRIEPNSVTQLLFPQLDAEDKKKFEVLAKGLPASPGAAIGKLAFTAEEVKERVSAGEKDVLLCREETCPDDIEGMNLAKGIVTARGGMTSHAAVVARGMGKCCVCGCGDLHIDAATKTISVGSKKFGPSDFFTLDGSTGQVYAGKVQVKDAEVSGNFETILNWANEFKRLGVRTNAETERDAKKAREFGAEGIGLARTEHMFFQGTRIRAVREMILSENVQGREVALAKLLPLQKGDFKDLFTVNEGLPVNIRLLDPPLHEFLPQTPAEMEEMSKEMGVSVEKIKVLCTNMHETNPMLGFRGCRLGVVYPEISRMQVRAIMEAACEVVESRADFNFKGVEIMIPVLAHMEEMKMLRELAVGVANKVLEEHKLTIERVPYTVGVMMELPRACIRADDIAQYADFFSFGTNDLTQTTLGYSRDDAGKFIPLYLEKGIYEKDPFQVLDQNGVGELIKMSVTKGRTTKPNLKCGICGEHGGEPSSVEFCHRVGLNYVSCSPFRVPVARIAAAQAAIKEKRAAK
ncbi:pyruvate phosphate dikinase 2 (PPDK2) [Monocercomonoides exilis]|uniref:Pyruvate, phosphate dikinase n=1 Tax=Monocercomonoides exilis TaxID=2049356 RepID=A1BQT1_9EUKA|nr:pyruvate phosphate dikinase 1 [Monocercomonoides exilis]KAH7818005.1 pyruvate phosphate dikinase 2 (PPDK2) [Monocercomonoides exilis]|eukprot:MONOS_3132.1-p1 / transcript=MONOS_3132.1 / gene=MONOS_3132 / organism=Monocercomonoides_exilis_PA203 / gene_product=pyruvate phosphate dikinase 2 (PPDK2) / transcript_product=pyruvate phosphate dikinase 2 (PPDK2) / location=Mono_scaffold00071:41605-45137(-) / protein_length=879 / sequence_SO=supercontig / SO=protein_coding / is_pseudo=false